MWRIFTYIAVLFAGAGGGYAAGSRHTAATVPETKISANPTESFKENSAKNSRLDLSISDNGVYRVRKVIDGDSIILENGVRVCYNGTRAPETGHYVKDPAPLAAEAMQRNAELVEGKQVRLLLAKDPFDIHGRLIARVMLPAPLSDGNKSGPANEAETDVGRQLVREGLSRAFGLGISAEEYHALKAVEETAKSEKAGMWGLEDQLRKSEKSGRPYCASGTSTLYHLATCPIALRIKAQNRHEYGSIEEAEEAGKNPCRKCVPR